MKKKTKSMGSKPMGSKVEMEMCNCGCAGASCRGNGCCGANCGSCYGGGCAASGEGNWRLLKYVKLLVGLVLVASAVYPAIVSTQMAVGLLGLWIVFKFALKMLYKC